MEGLGRSPFWQRGPEWQKLIDVKALHHGREADVPGVWRCVCFNCDFGKVASFPYNLVSKWGNYCLSLRPANCLLKDLIMLSKLIYCEGTWSWKFLMSRNITMGTDGTGGQKCTLSGKSSSYSWEVNYLFLGAIWLP